MDFYQNSKDNCKFSDFLIHTGFSISLKNSKDDFFMPFVSNMKLYKMEIKFACERKNYY